MARPDQRWQRALLQLPATDIGQWAVTGSAALALQGLAVEPRDVDVVAEESAAIALTDHLDGLVVEDEVGWDRGDVRAARRSLAIVEGVELEILVGVQSHSNGAVQLNAPNLTQVDLAIVGGRDIPVLTLQNMIPILEAMGKYERAAMAKDELVRRNLEIQ
jgi:hypothetical protein